MDYRGVIVGLGNPGAKYDHTRHNCGFDFVSYLVDLAGREGEVSQQNGGKFSCELWRLRLPKLGGCWLAAKPQTFMNLSGQCVQPLLAWHKLKPQNLVVVHDELDIPAGELRFKLGGGNAGHNGLKSIAQELGSPAFVRLRLGIGRPEGRDVAGYVLEAFRGDEMSVVRKVMPAAVDGIMAFYEDGLETAQRRVGGFDAVPPPPPQP